MDCRTNVTTANMKRCFNLSSKAVGHVKYEITGLDLSRSRSAKGRIFVRVMPVYPARTIRTTSILQLKSKVSLLRSWIDSGRLIQSKRQRHFTKTLNIQGIWHFRQTSFYLLRQ